MTDELKARGHEVSRQYLGHLLTGERDNPTLSLLEVLADVFKVPVMTFLALSALSMAMDNRAFRSSRPPAWINE